jgi:hypothetical protein
MGRMSNPFSWWRMLYWRFRWYVYPRRRYATKCQYCGIVTGHTLHRWATEDVCDACGSLLHEVS